MNADDDCHQSLGKVRSDCLYLLEKIQALYNKLAQLPPGSSDDERKNYAAEIRKITEQAANLNHTIFDTEKTD